MVKDFKTENTDGRLFIEKALFGLGFHIDFISATFGRDKLLFLHIDIIFIRFWFTIYKDFISWTKVSDKYDKPKIWWFHKILCEIGWSLKGIITPKMYTYHLSKMIRIGFDIHGLEAEKDYFIKNGLYVFTKSHHLKRGFCCESGCLNCPYGFKDGKIKK